MRRGEVCWAEAPDWPRRPVLVMTRDETLDHLNDVFVVLATTSVRGLTGWPDEDARAASADSDDPA